MSSFTLKRELLDFNLYKVAWIAPRDIEAQAAKHMLDVVHEGQFPDDGSDYIYIAGEMSRHNVTIVTFPAGHEYNAGSAIALAGHIWMNFHHIHVGLLIGVAEGIPPLANSRPGEISLGDIRVVMFDSDNTVVTGHRLSKYTVRGLKVLKCGKTIPRTASSVALAVSGMMYLEFKEKNKLFGPLLTSMQGQERATGAFAIPSQGEDDLYTGDGQMLPRPARRSDRGTLVWYAQIGPGGKFWTMVRPCDVRSGNYYPAAGVEDCLPADVIHGVYEYGDSHKNKGWQPYAVAITAAYTKGLLHQIPTTTPSATTSGFQVQDGGQNTLHSRARVVQAAGRTGPELVTPDDADVPTVPTRRSLPPCYVMYGIMMLIVTGSAILGLYFAVRLNRMGDGFTAAGWIVAVGTLALAGPVARHYPHCTCWRMSGRGFRRVSTFPAT